MVLYINKTALRRGCFTEYFLCGRHKGGTAGVSNIYIACETDKGLADYLASCGHTVIDVEKTDCVYDAVAEHPDIYMCKLGADPAAPLYKGDKSKLGFRYPENIIYNAAVCGRYFIHNLKYTDGRLLEAAQDYVSRRYGCAMIRVNTAQGYTKCNIAIVDDSHIITEDKGIFRAVSEKTDIKVLLIAEKQVKLNGFSHGFIGGAAGRVGNEIIFNGDITAHSDYVKIRSFIEECGLDIKSFAYPLTDIGSIIEEKL